MLRMNGSGLDISQLIGRYESQVLPVGWAIWNHVIQNQETFSLDRKGKVMYRKCYGFSYVSSMVLLLLSTTENATDASSRAYEESLQTIFTELNHHKTDSFNKAIDAD